MACFLILLTPVNGFFVLFCFRNEETKHKMSKHLEKGECYKISQTPRSESSPEAQGYRPDGSNMSRGSCPLCPLISNDKALSSDKELPSQSSPEQFSASVDR